MEIQFERFHRLINDLSRTDRSGDSSLNLTRLDLAELLRTIAEQRRDALRESPGRIRHELDFRGPDRAEIRGDRERLEQAFHHVIDNAIKFSPRGGTVEITLESDEEMHRVAVRDQESGSPPRIWRRSARGSFGEATFRGATTRGSDSGWRSLGRSSNNMAAVSR